MAAESPARLRKKGSGFTQVPNLLINDNRISFRAKGIWALIESKPDGWIFREVNLITCSTEGRDAFRAAAKELIEYGWLKRFQERNSQGHFVTIYELMYSPLTENPSTVKPSTVSPSTENQATYKDGGTKKEEQPPLPPAGPGVWEGDDQFMELVKLYTAIDPARTDTPKAWGVWVANGFKADAAKILQALPHYAGTRKFKEGYAPNLSRWLGEEGWRNVADGNPAPEELEDQARARKKREKIISEGMAAYHRVEWDKKRGKASAPADLEAVRVWYAQQAAMTAKGGEADA